MLGPSEHTSIQKCRAMQGLNPSLFLLLPARSVVPCYKTLRFQKTLFIILNVVQTTEAMLTRHIEHLITSIHKINLQEQDPDAPRDFRCEFSFSGAVRPSQTRDK